MKILVTGAKGFVGKNLVVSLENIRDGKDRVHPIEGLENPEKLNICCYDIDSSFTELEEACRDCDFVYHLAGVNRPKEEREYREGNCGFSEILIETLEKYGNPCPIVLSSSIQASLTGRFAQSEYGKSKLAAEQLFMDYAIRSGARVLIYRFPNLFGKWCRPNYNSVVATFCHNIANDLPIQVNDESTELELLYIDDLIEELLGALNKREHRCEFQELQVIPCATGTYCYAPVTYKVTLGEIVCLLDAFRKQPDTLQIPRIPESSFAKKLYSTYLSYLPEKKVKYSLKTGVDVRGSFTELLKFTDGGQISVNISKPGAVKGEHWHHTKWEIFVVVSGHGLIRQRKLGSNEIMEFQVSGEHLEAIQMLPGYTHSITNLSDTQDMITLMWANEPFDQGHPDTFREGVVK